MVPFAFQFHILVEIRGHPVNPKHQKKRMGHQSDHNKQLKGLISLFPNDQMNSNYNSL